ncbi:iron-sulfur cluster biosynthesis protein [Actinocrinis puniceicyclus]|uniref:Iron-sulfur cluster biosynthesis protein n=1 Tax=Actinocrinis puniceicyclus TaxID=977794 RepID=A0A8J7WMI6_9ACTN|nr:adhesin [Actinocrinis puniceicyclus]MBS2962892.1 iron-sulfur cluster biosynthesis protein [Actinocrinis puniceicyclus]
MLALTDTAVGVIHDLTTQPGLPDGTGLRIAPQAGDNGVGPAFALSLSQAPQAADEVIETADTRVYLEPGVAQQLDDKVLDAHIDEQGEIAFLISQQQPPHTPWQGE